MNAEERAAAASIIEKSYKPMPQIGRGQCKKKTTEYVLMSNIWYDDKNWILEFFFLRNKPNVVELFPIHLDSHKEDNFLMSMPKPSKRLELSTSHTIVIFVRDRLKPEAEKDDLGFDFKNPPSPSELLKIGMTRKDVWKPSFCRITVDNVSRSKYIAYQPQLDNNKHIRLEFDVVIIKRDQQQVCTLVMCETVARNGMLNDTINRMVFKKYGAKSTKRCNLHKHKIYHKPDGSVDELTTAAYDPRPSRKIEEITKWHTAEKHGQQQQHNGNCHTSSKSGGCCKGKKNATTQTTSGTAPARKGAGKIDVPVGPEGVDIDFLLDLKRNGKKGGCKCECECHVEDTSCKKFASKSPPISIDRFNQILCNAFACKDLPSGGGGYSSSATVSCEMSSVASSIMWVEEEDDNRYVEESCDEEEVERAILEDGENVLDDEDDHFTNLRIHRPKYITYIDACIVQAYHGQLDPNNNNNNSKAAGVGIPNALRKVRRRRKVIGSGQNRRDEKKVVDYSQLSLSTTRMLARRFNDDQDDDNVKMPSKWNELRYCPDYVCSMIEQFRRKNSAGDKDGRVKSSTTGDRGRQQEEEEEDEDQYEACHTCVKQSKDKKKPKQGGGRKKRK